MWFWKARKILFLFWFFDVEKREKQIAPRRSLLFAMLLACLVIARVSHRRERSTSGWRFGYKCSKERKQWGGGKRISGGKTRTKSFGGG